MSGIQYKHHSAKHRLQMLSASLMYLTNARLTYIHHHQSILNSRSRCHGIGMLYRFYRFCWVVYIGLRQAACRQWQGKHRSQRRLVSPRRLLLCRRRRCRPLRSSGSLKPEQITLPHPTLCRPCQDTTKRHRFITLSAGWLISRRLSVASAAVHHAVVIPNRVPKWTA